MTGGTSADGAQQPERIRTNAPFAESADQMRRKSQYRRGPIQAVRPGHGDSGIPYPGPNMGNARIRFDVKQWPGEPNMNGHVFFKTAWEHMIQDGYVPPGTYYVRKVKRDGRWWVHSYYYVVYRNPEIWWAWYEAGCPGDKGPQDAVIRQRPHSLAEQSRRSHEAFTNGYLYYADYIKGGKMQQ